MKNLFLLIVLFTASSVIISCSSELDQEPISIISNNSFWKTKDDAEGAILGAYVDLRTTANTDLYILGEGRSDILGIGLAGDGGYRKYYENTVNADDAGPSWRNFYKIINSSNLILKYVPDIDFSGDENAKSRILAEAYTMRAFTYFVMVRTWGDLIIHTEPIESSNPNLTNIERSSKQEVFNLIKSDLEMAIQLFPDNEIPSGRNRWSKVGAKALKGDVFLWTGKMLNGGEEDFKIALNAFNDVANTGGLELLPNFSDVHDFDNKGNSEIIMSVRYDEHESGSNYIRDMYIMDMQIPTGIDSETREKIGQGGGNAIVVPTKYIADKFLLDDSRRSATFLEIFSQGKLSTIIAKKNSGVVINGNRQFINDVVLYRLADIFLMRAETLNALNMDPSDDINRIRKRAYGDSYTDHIFINRTQSLNDEEILSERLFELMLEGKRWWDLVRFNKVFELVPSLQGKSDDKYLLWPIDNEILSLEPKVNQNPGWGF
ncbi:RagB/SusD family nutrient uptake outer membrane protein [Arenibacter latericius]|uniref:RagB/SusD family nutrient uptake outer membrane protein n=1 Tax=Arenibacter latericius TaxID=86104 RepID=UPI000410F4D7|nr:RagB/SusD family nutrient uptake outer membrane protein [Arenibacter latericius]